MFIPILLIPSNDKMYSIIPIFGTFKYILKDHILKFLRFLYTT